MIKSEKTIILKTEIEKIWKVLTDNENTSWRSDLSRVEIIDEINFIEYTTKGVKTEFKITKKQPYEFYEFEIKNENLTGYFTAKLREIENKKTELILTEEVKVKNPIMRVFAKSYLKKQQQTYANDIQKTLNGSLN